MSGSRKRAQALCARMDVRTFAADMLPIWAFLPCSRLVPALSTVTGTCMALFAAGPEPRLLRFVITVVTAAASPHKYACTNNVISCAASSAAHMFCATQPGPAGGGEHRGVSGASGLVCRPATTRNDALCACLHLVVSARLFHVTTTFACLHCHLHRVLWRSRSCSTHTQALIHGVGPATAAATCSWAPRR